MSELPSPKPQSRSEIVQGCIVAAVMAWGLGWLVDSAWHSSNAWFKVGVAVFLVPMLLWFAFIAWMATCQWLDKRRCAREGRNWEP